MLSGGSFSVISEAFLLLLLLEGGYNFLISFVGV